VIPCLKQSSADRHPPATNPRTRVPAPQRVRVLQKFATGKSIVQIAREEKRNRETVARIVHSDEMNDYVRQMREKFYGLADLAIAAVQHALAEERDAQVGYRILLDTGVIPSPDERQHLQSTPAVNDPMQGFKDQLARIVGIQLERRHIYGTPFPELDEDIEKAGMKINPETGGLEPIVPE